VVYTIFSVLSLVFVSVWLFYSLHQLLTTSTTDLWLKLFLSLGSSCSYFFGALLWLGLSGFLSQETRNVRCLLGPKLILSSSFLFLILSIFYFLTSQQPAVTISKQEEKIDENIGETPSKLSYEIPEMNSVRIEGRFQYPNSVEYEATENIPIA
jgi:hypothetical protein